MSTRSAAWIAIPVGLLSSLMGIFGPVFGWLNGLALLDLLEEDGPGAILAVSVSIVGAVVASRRPTNPLGWIFCAVGLSQGLVTLSYEYAAYALITNPGALPGGPLAAWFSFWSWMPGLGLLLTFALLLFPNGRLPSARWRAVAWLSAFDLALIIPLAAMAWPRRGQELLADIDASGSSGSLFDIFDVAFPLMLACGLASVVSLLLRFRASRGVERQQIKWFSYAAALTFAGLIASELIGQVVGYASLLLLLVAPSLPLAAGAAILRYRLWDIDLIVRRTLIYGALTATLALVYFGSVAVLQSVLTAVSRRPSAVVTVVSTLAIAALFSPLRRRVQGFIDRRFYRRKYDAARTLEAFGAAARDETDLDRLSGRLLGVVRETVQPAHASLWLRREERRIDV